MREKIRHARSLAMRQKQSGGPADVRWSGGRENKGYEEEVRSKVKGLKRNGQKQYHSTESRITRVIGAVKLTHR